MDKLKHIKEDLEWVVYKTLEANEDNNFKNINTYELGEAIDMIKDISEAIYYCQVVHAMEEGSGTITYTQKSPKGEHMTTNIAGVSHPEQAMVN